MTTFSNLAGVAVTAANFGASGASFAREGLECKGVVRGSLAPFLAVKDEAAAGAGAGAGAGAAAGALKP